MEQGTRSIDRERIEWRVEGGERANEELMYRISMDELLIFLSPVREVRLCEVFR